MSIGIIGLGYVGLPLSILFAKKGFRIYGIDINKKKIKLIRKKKTYIERISSKKISILTEKKNQCFSNFNKISECDFIVICVPTPLGKNNKPDLSYIKTTINKITPKLRFGQSIILESTSYPGTTREEIVNKLSKKFQIGYNFFVGFSSERINPGFNENTIDKIPKVVSGCSSNCLDLLSKFYESTFFKIVKCKSLEVAEFSKLLENIYRAVNIGFINEMKLVADKMKLDIYDIIKVAKTKPFGFRPFNPGPGIGGHCIPIDPHYLFWKAKKKGINANFIRLSAKTNASVISFIKNKILKIIKKLSIKNQKAKILILGVSYKKDVDDLRESASVKLIQELLKNNFKKVYWSDPYIKNQIITTKFKYGKKVVKLSGSRLKLFDIVILMTDHDKFNYNMIYKNSKKIIDCRGRYQVDQKVIRA